MKHCCRQYHIAGKQIHLTIMVNVCAPALPCETEIDATGHSVLRFTPAALQTDQMRGNSDDQQRNRTVHFEVWH